MKTFIALFLAWIIVPLPSAAQAETLHMIVITDSKDSEIGKGAQGNARAFIDYGNIVARITKLTPKVVDVSADRFTCNAIKTAVNAAEVASADFRGAFFAPDVALAYDRDIAPKNIMIAQPFMPILIDFGAARQLVAQHSQTFAALLTPGSTGGCSARKCPSCRVGGLQHNAGGAIIAHNASRADIEACVQDDPFVTEGVVIRPLAHERGAMGAWWRRSGLGPPEETYPGCATIPAHPRGRSAAQTWALFTMFSPLLLSGRCP